MSFLTPLFLAGGLAVALPLLFHLIRRSVKERTVFSSLMFLQPSLPRLTRRSRLENLLLLFLRCLAICLLATGFARPFLRHAFPETPPSRPGLRVALLLDTSASMRRGTLWNAVRQKAETILRNLGPADAFALYSFDDRLRLLISFDEWNRLGLAERTALARSRLADLRPGWGGTALDSALIDTAEAFGAAFKEADSAQGRIIVISDFQEGSRVTGLQGHEWPKGIEVVSERVLAAPGNAGIQLATPSGEGAAGPESAVRVRITNASDSKREQFQAGWSGADGAWAGNPIEVYVPAGQSRIVSLPMAQTNGPAERVSLRGDNELFDNVAFFVPPAKSELGLLYVGGDSEDDATQPFFFLKTAMQDTARQSIRIVKPAAGSLPGKAQLESAALIVVTSSLQRDHAAALREAVLAGKTLLFAPVNAAAAAGLSALLETSLPLPITDRKASDYALLGQIQFAHPLFAPFADSRFSDFSKIHFWQYRKMDVSGLPDARVLARFDSGDPAVVEVPLGKGRVVVMSAGWHPADSQLALSSKFVPLLYSLIELGSATAPAPSQFLVGNTVAVPAGAVIHLPSGATARLAQTEARFTVQEPGIFSVEAPAGSTRLAVNLEPSESRTAPLPLDELDRLGVPGPRPAPVARSDAERKVRLQNDQAEARQKLWRWFILGTLAVLAAETWLAGRTTRRAAALEETP